MMRKSAYALYNRQHLIRTYLRNLYLRPVTHSAYSVDSYAGFINDIEAISVNGEMVPCTI